MINFISRQWFLISLVACLIIGFSLSGNLQALGENLPLRYSIVFGVMFLMAWSLKTSQIWTSIRNPKAPLLASTLNLLILPLAAWPSSWLLNSDLGTGFLATAATPCTLATAAVWTRRAGGNDVTALMTTVITNSVCFLVTPLWISVMASRSTDGIDMGAMILKLFLLILLPMALAQLTRVHAGIARWSTAQKPRLGIVAQVGILIMILIAAIQMGNKTTAGGDSSFWISMGILTVLCSVLHFGILYLGIFAAKKIGCEPADQIAVGISGSQKTMMVGLTASLELGVSVLPMVVYHTIQLLGDTPIVDRFRRKHFSESNSSSD